MGNNNNLEDSFLEVVNNQISTNLPPETALTYQRLIKEGYSNTEAKKLIAQCIENEVHFIIKEQKPFNEDRYIKTLKNLPHNLK